jgi:hypothetical protein
MEDETEDNIRPNCPYCNDASGECEHVLLDYDASFMEFISGYLVDDQEEIEKTKSLILELIQTDKTPTLESGYVKDIWEYAVDNYTPTSEEIELDISAYVNFVDDNIDLLNGESNNYGGEDGAPGYSSSYVILFAKDPAATIRAINALMIEEFRG